MKIQTTPDVVPGSIWTATDGNKFFVRGIVAQAGDIWIHYQQMGTQQTYHCLVESFQQRFSIYTNHDYRGSVWKLSSML